MPATPNAIPSSAVIFHFCMERSSFKRTAPHHSLGLALPQAGEEGEDCRVGLRGLLLLHPVAGALNERDTAQIGRNGAHRRAQLLFVRAANHGVLGAGDEMHRLWDGLARQLRGDLPVTMPVPVEVDRTAEARTRELRDVVVEILLRQ